MSKEFSVETNQSVKVSKKDFPAFLKSMAMNEEEFIQYSKEIAVVLVGKIKAITDAYEDFVNVYKDINPFTASMMHVGVVLGVRLMEEKVCLGINGDPNDCKQVVQDMIVNIMGAKFEEKKYE